MSLFLLFSKLKGGKSSGNFNHSGILGEQGGSAPSTLNVFYELFSKEENYVNELFNEGNPTCFYASKKVVDLAKEQNIPVMVADGEYKDSGHFFPILSFMKNDGFYDRYIVDLGNNIDSEAIESGNIKPIIKKFPNPDYKVDEMMTPKEFNKYLKRI